MDLLGTADQYWGAQAPKASSGSPHTLGLLSDIFCDHILHHSLYPLRCAPCQGLLLLVCGKTASFALKEKLFMSN